MTKDSGSNLGGDVPRGRGFCASCGAEIRLWFDPAVILHEVNADDENYALWA